MYDYMMWIKVRTNVGNEVRGEVFAAHFFLGRKDRNRLQAEYRSILTIQSVSQHKADFDEDRTQPIIKAMKWLDDMS